MKELKAVSRESYPSDAKTVFLAGSIEMGVAEKWQDRIAQLLCDREIVVFNPRRDDWDSSWTQDPTPGTQFHEQVTWELEHIQKCDLLIVYFDPKTLSPITLMELGYAVGSKKGGLIVCCPDGFYRKGNVIITSLLNSNAIITHTFDELVMEVNKWMDAHI